MKSNNFRGVCVIFITCLLVLSFVNSVFAITGSIKNARMIIRVEQGDTIERYIQVNNVNDVAVDIELFASGELEKEVKIKENKFRLEPDESKKVYFSIVAKKSGTTETRINVKFTPVDGTSGVGLSSAVIIIAESSGFWDDVFGKNNDKDSEDSGDDSGNNGTGTTGDVIGDGDKNPMGLIIVSLTTGILVLALIILIIIASKRKNFNREILVKKSDKIKPKKKVQEE